FLPQVKLGLPGLKGRGEVNPNALAGTALLFAPLLCAFVFAPFKRASGLLLRALAGVASLLGALVILVAQSRTALVGAGLTLAVLALRMGDTPRARVRFGIGMLLAASAIAIATAAAVPDAVNAFASQTWSSAARRTDVWQQGLRYLAMSPLAGIGLNEFRNVYVLPEAYLQAQEYGWLLYTHGGAFDVAHAHNILLQTALDVGLVGFSAYLAITAIVLQRADRAARGPRSVAGVTSAGAGLALVAVHFFGVADAIAVGAKVGIFQWFAAGLVLAAWRLQGGGHGLPESRQAARGPGNVRERPPLPVLRHID
ncbi:MAG: O-antigen ligase family protein, partial [Desulfobacterales bacterium]|nr:O-antigen ligase family protein [Desulfobacterales bacterium]